VNQCNFPVKTNIKRTSRLHSEDVPRSLQTQFASCTHSIYGKSNLQTNTAAMSHLAGTVDTVKED